MHTTPMPATLRRWLERRLLSADPSCDSFELRYLNDGSPLRTVSVPQGGKLDKVLEHLVDEFEEASRDHAQTSDGMHRFSVEAFGPRPERRSLGSFPFPLITSGAGAYAKQLGPGASNDTLPTAFDALERLAPDGLVERPSSRMQDLALLVQALQGATGSAVPAATLKVGLDYSQAIGRQLIEVLPTVVRLQNDTIEKLMGHIDTMRARDIESHEMLGELLLARDVRKAEVKALRRKEKAKSARMERLMNAGEALLPDLIEQFKGESPVIELLNTLDDNTMALLQQHLSPKQRKLIDMILERAKRRAEKIAKGKEKQPAKKAKEGEAKR
jgi:hypothetical protein